jgi:hypothetical protein
MCELLHIAGDLFACSIALSPQQNVQARVAEAPQRPVGRPPNEVRRYHARFSYQAQRPRRVVAKVEWHPSELYPRVGFVVTNLARRAEGVVAFYNQRARLNNGSNNGSKRVRAQ